MEVWKFGTPHYVYRCFGADGVALYVGCTINPTQRLSAHRSRAPWSKDIAYTDITEHINRPAALRVERAETRRLDPLHNLVNTPRNPHLRDALLAASK